MKDKQLEALIRKASGKVGQAKPGTKRFADPTLEATKTPEQETDEDTKHPLQGDEAAGILITRSRRGWYAVLITLCCACAAGDPASPVNIKLPDEPDLPVLVGAATPVIPLEMLNVETYEHSGQSVHPDVVYFPAAWHGWEYWMAYTPYPQASVSSENPSIVVSHDGEHWQVPDGLFNPLVDQPEVGYNSDPDLSYDAPRDRLVLIYRSVDNTDNIIHSRFSADGITWSSSHVILRQPNHGIVSPTMTLLPSGAPTIWYVDAGQRFCPERSTRVMMQTGKIGSLAPKAGMPGWSSAIQTDLVQPGYNIWHLDVIWVPERNEYWAVYPAYKVNTCEGDELFFARSADGVHWLTYTIPFLARRPGEWTENSLYRASMLYNAQRNTIRFFLSGDDPLVNWHLGYVEYKLPEFLAWLRNGTPDPRPSTLVNPLRFSLRHDEP